MKRTIRSRDQVVATWGCLAILATACGGSPANRPASGNPPPPPAAPATRWCDQLPRPANRGLEPVAARSDWFEVRKVAQGVFALLEPRQFQEAISYLIVGRNRALLFDSGLGLVPIRPVVEQLTTLPIEVVNSHTHYDHTGGNHEFDQIRAVDSPYTRSNARGFPHAELAGEVAASSFCGGPPAGVDTAAFQTRPWKASRTVADGDTIDLGERIIEVLQVPGHTPDALALLDRSARLLWTGDSYYDGWVWLYVPETDLDAYERSMTRLAALAPSLEHLLPAHNTATASPERLSQVRGAIRQVRSGAIKGTDQGDNRIVFEFDGFGILTSKQLLEGKAGDRTSGGSGLTTWR